MTSIFKGPHKNKAKIPTKTRVIKGFQVYILLMAEILQPPGIFKTLVNNGINYQPQLVQFIPLFTLFTKGSMYTKSKSRCIFSTLTRGNSPPCWAKKRRRWPGQLGHQKPGQKPWEIRKTQEIVGGNSYWNPKLCFEIFESLINTVIGFWREWFNSNILKFKNSDGLCDQLPSSFYYNMPYLYLTVIGMPYLTWILWLWLVNLPPLAYNSQKQGPIKGL